MSKDLPESRLEKIKEAAATTGELLDLVGGGFILLATYNRIYIGNVINGPQNQEIQGPLEAIKTRLNEFTDLFKTATNRNTANQDLETLAMAIINKIPSGCHSIMIGPLIRIIPCRLNPIAPQLSDLGESAHNYLTLVYSFYPDSAPDVSLTQSGNDISELLVQLMETESAFGYYRPENQKLITQVPAYITQAYQLLLESEKE